VQVFRFVYPTARDSHGWLPPLSWHLAANQGRDITTAWSGMEATAMAAIAVILGP
jgi:hypothetical protein